MNQTFETPGPLRLAIDIPSGEIDLAAGPGTQTTVDADGPEEVRVELRDLGGGSHELVVEAPRRRGFAIGRGDYKVRIACPEGATAQVRSKSADIHGRGRLGAVDIASAAGDVELEQVDGDAQVKSASGDVHLGRVSGGVSVSSASGDLEIGSVAGQLVANTVSGDIVVRDAHSDVRANSVSGDQQLEAVRQGTVQAQSVSGDVTIGIRRGARVYLDCNSLSGATSSELELSGEPVGEEGLLVEIRAKTVSGDIRIVRAAASVTEEVTS
jgi:DUF4097 and DUF4098 domain-containing protein YvlB